MMLGLKLVWFLAAGLLLAGCQRPPSDAALSSDASIVARGEYLIIAGLCHDCHSPKVFTAAGLEPDPDRLLAGHPPEDQLAPIPEGVIGLDGWGALASNHLTAWAGPWGVSFGMNLTPDPETGLGTWTDEMFITALRTGRHQGTGRDILPPMPWTFIGSMTDDDLRAMFAYLQSLPPIRNPIPEPVAPEQIPR